jgi:hypothetical protein
MDTKFEFTARTNRNAGMPHGEFVAVAAAMFLLVPALAHAASAGGSEPASKSSAVVLESIPGSTAKRVILTARAAERLGIEVGKVAEAAVVRRQMVSGLIIRPMDKAPEQKPASGTFGGFGQSPAALEAKPKSIVGARSNIATVASASPLPPLPISATPSAEGAPTPILGEAWVLVTLSQGEWDRLAKDKPARLLPLATRDKLANELVAQPSGMQPIEDPKRSMLTLYYTVPGKDHGLALNSRMRVELEVAGSDEKQKILPYGAVYYDAKGAAWVYVNSKPLTFERQRIVVERVVGDLAVMSEGPPVGTPVVTVGAALLYGTEIFGK